MNEYLNYFIVPGWELEVIEYDIVAKQISNASELQPNVYYLDPRATLGADFAKDTNVTLADGTVLEQNTGMYKDFPVKTFDHLWNNCIDHTQKSIIYLYSYVTFDTYVEYDFSNITFIICTNPQTSNLYFTTYFLQFKQGAKISNLTVDAGDFDKSNAYAVSINGASNVYDVEINNINIK